MYIPVTCFEKCKILQDYRNCGFEAGLCPAIPYKLHLKAAYWKWIQTLSKGCMHSSMMLFHPFVESDHFCALDGMQPMGLNLTFQLFKGLRALVVLLKLAPEKQGLSCAQAASIATRPWIV